jgi:hypothetical protein
MVADTRKPFLNGNLLTRMQVVGEQTPGVGTVYRWAFTLSPSLCFTVDEVVTERLVTLHRRGAQ